ncbi:lipoprotein-releasing ABC transporter permease subunit [Pseudoalteromonas fenneropenaei]|uniref:Lipoprotein-releasing ABC transporter permease subunit n=1 Tax=Pseudoalteromonas fenneropenaei TaxID=1737459 RepID=A0ABV7CF85_9GAMM
MKLSWFLSKRFRQSNHHSGLVGFLSKASTIGVMLGVSVLIVALSVVNGFEQQLVQRLLSVVAHVEYHAPEKPIKNWPSKIALLEQHQQIAAATPQIKLTAMVQFKGQLKAAQVEAILPSEYHKVSQLDNYVKGQAIASLQEHELILGKQIAKTLNAEVGDKITLLVADEQAEQPLAAPKRVTLTLVGLVDMGGPLDQSLALMHLAKAQQILGLTPDEVTDIRVSVLDVFSAHYIAMQAGRLLPDLVYVNSWYRSQGSLYQDIQMVRTIVYLVVFLIIAVASFNIVSSMVMEVKDKQADIAILKTMGARDSTIFSTFALQGIGYAMVGSLLGTFIGVVLAMNVPDLFQYWVSLSEHNPLDGVYFVNFLPTKLQWQDVLVTVAGTLSIATLATLYPAWRATKIDPAVVLGN